jgi:predicted O-linked N-acetylglucosamine transferase (SPINDLY family)
MAIPTMDYLIADKVVIDSASRQHYDEAIVFMPESYQVNRSLNPTPLCERSEMLSVSGKARFAFCCFNNTHKITEEIFNTWMKILRRSPDAVMYLLDDNPYAVKNLKLAAKANGVESDRLIFLPRESMMNHLKRHQFMDIALDTFPYNGHTTSSDALRMNIPVITLAGRSFASRVTSSLLGSLALSELVADNLNDYEDLAVSYTIEPSKLRQTKEKLAKNKTISMLFQPKIFAEQLEKSFMIMINRLQKNESPTDIHL